MNPMLDDARKAMNAAARKCEESRQQYNADVKAWKAAKLRWEKLSEAQLFADAELEEMRQRALKDGRIELANLLAQR